MNRSLAIGALLALALSSGVAPRLQGQGRRAIGVELGYTRASFSGRNSGGVTLHEGAVAGAYFQTRLFRGLVFRPGIQIASKGGATSVVPDGATAPVRIDLDLVYLDLPMLLRTRLPFLGNTRLLFTAGAVPSLRIGCNIELSDVTGTLSRDECGQGNNVADFRTIDLQALGGVGFGIPIESSELSIEARVTQSVRSISDIADIRNRALTVLISVPF